MNKAASRSKIVFQSILVLLLLIAFNRSIVSADTLISPFSVEDAYTVSLLHMNGADGSQAFTDETGKVWNAYGNAQIDTAQSVFGGSSALFDGSGDYLSAPDSADFDFGSGDFTIDFWVRFNSLSTPQHLVTKLNTSLYGPFAITIDGSYVYCASSSNGTSWGMIFAWPYGGHLAVGEWHHFAFVRNGSDWRFYLDGVSRASTTVSQTVMPNITDVTIGANADGSFPLNGWMDELRISKGIARWTNNFTPPASEYTFATPTPTATFTPTSTPTVTPTSTPTNTPPPNHGGSGTCWSSANSWEGYTAFYAIDRNTIPVSKGWDDSIIAAARTWNDVVPSHFEFVYSEVSINVISFQQPSDQNALAEVGPLPILDVIDITQKWMKINPAYSWDTNNTPTQGNPDSNGETTFNVQNVVTHELGHWLMLWDTYDTTNCAYVTMYEWIEPGEIKKITLEGPDIEAINWQYP